MDGNAAGSGTVRTVEAIAELISTFVAADLRLADVMDRIEGSRRPVSNATVRFLEELLQTTLRPAVAAGDTLAEVARDEPGLFRAAVAVYQQRRRAAAGASR